MRGIRIALAVVGMAVLTAPGAMAQRGLGSINGVLTSEDGAPVSGAMVKLEMAGGDLLEGKTDGTGKFNIPGIGKGEFHLEVVKDGFATKRVKVVVERESLRPEPIKLSLKKA